MHLMVWPQPGRTSPPLPRSLRHSLSSATSTITSLRLLELEVLFHLLLGEWFHLKGVAAIVSGHNLVHISVYQLQKQFDHTRSRTGGKTRDSVHTVVEQPTSERPIIQTIAENADKGSFGESSERFFVQTIREYERGAVSRGYELVAAAFRCSRGSPPCACSGGAE